MGEVTARSQLPQENRSRSERQRISERLAAIQFAIEHRGKELTDQATKRDTLWKKLSWETISDFRTRSAIDEFVKRVEQLKQRLDGVEGDDQTALAVIEGDIDVMRAESRTYAVPDILRLSHQAEVELDGLEREQQPVVEIDSYGKPKLSGKVEEVIPPSEIPDLKNAEEDEGVGEAVLVETSVEYTNDKREATKEGRLGEFGQDYMLVDPVSGGAVVADGAASLVDSHEVARLSSKAIMAILNGIPDTADQQFVDTYVRSRMPEVASAIEAMHRVRSGGAVFVAVRYLPLARVLVHIQLGDCHGVVRSEGREIKRLAQAPDERYRKNIDLRIKKDLSPTGSILKLGDQPGTIQGRLLVELIPLPPGEVTVTLASDGVQNNTGKHIAEWAEQMKKDGVQSVLDSIPNNKDDLTTVQLRIPAQEHVVSSSAKQAVA